MSEPLRLALVAEGPTDRIVIEAAISRILDGRQFVLNQLQPEASLAFGPLGGGWGGVYRWCRQSVTRSGGSLGADPLFEFHDVLVLHLDADVAKEKYQNANIHQNAGDLPCAEPCPPAQATTDRLREVLLGWAGEMTPPNHTVLCIPANSTEAWVIAALFPNDPAVLADDFECRQHAQQPKRVRIKKNVSDYERQKLTLQNAWPEVTTVCTEARRFTRDLRRVVRTVDATARLLGT